VHFSIGSNDLVMGYRAPATGGLKPITNLNGLHGLDAHNCTSQLRIQPAVGVNVATESRRAAVNKRFDYPTNGVAR
jgi:hypothetical protein